MVVYYSEVIRTILTEEDFAYDEHNEEKNEISLEKIEEPIKIAYFYLTQTKKRKG